MAEVPVRLCMAQLSHNWHTAAASSTSWQIVDFGDFGAQLSNMYKTDDSIQQCSTSSGISAHVLATRMWDSRYLRMSRDALQATRARDVVGQAIQRAGSGLRRLIIQDFKFTTLMVPGDIFDRFESQGTSTRVGLSSGPPSVSEMLKPLRQCNLLSELDMRGSSISYRQLLEMLPPPPFTLDRLFVDGIEGMRDSPRARRAACERLAQRTAWLDVAYCVACTELQASCGACAGGCGKECVCRDCVSVCKQCEQRFCRDCTGLGLHDTGDSDPPHHICALLHRRLHSPPTTVDALDGNLSEVSAFRCSSCGRFTCKLCAADPACDAMQCFGGCDTRLCMDCAVASRLSVCDICERIGCTPCRERGWAATEQCSRCQNHACKNCAADCGWIMRAGKDGTVCCEACASDP